MKHEFLQTVEAKDFSLFYSNNMGRHDKIHNFGT